MRDTCTIGVRRFILWRWEAAGAGVLGLAAVVASCGGDDATSAAPAANPTSVATAAQAATVIPAESPMAAAPTVAANPFGLKIPTVGSVSSADDDRWVLPADVSKIDKLVVGDPLEVGGGHVFIGTADGVLLAPVPGIVEKISHEVGSAYATDAYLVVLRLKGGNRIDIWVPAAGALAIATGGTVARGEVVARLTGRLDGPKTAGYSAILSLYRPDGRPRSLNETQWVGGVPAAYQKK